MRWPLRRLLIKTWNKSDRVHFQIHTALNPKEWLFSNKALNTNSGYICHPSLAMQLGSISVNTLLDDSTYPRWKMSHFDWHKWFWAVKNAAGYHQGPLTPYTTNRDPLIILYHSLHTYLNTHTRLLNRVRSKIIVQGHSNRDCAIKILPAPEFENRVCESKLIGVQTHLRPRAPSKRWVLILQELSGEKRMLPTKLPSLGKKYI